MGTRWARRNRLAVIAVAGVVAPSLILLRPPAAAAATASRLGPPNTWAGTGQMSTARAGQTATLLPGGQVLIAGGGTAVAELYHPATRTFSPTGRMPVAVTDATATLLPDGKVLVAGGLLGDGKQVASAELYDPATGTWSATGPMTKARSGQTATLLPDGQVLVAGGGCNGSGYGCNSGSYEEAQRSAELYNPATGTWARTGSMADGRQYAAATLLPDGTVLVAGGFNNCDDDFCSEVRTAELYDPATGTWARTGSMHFPREQFTATLLRNGQVLAAGGLAQYGPRATSSSAELYNPATGVWSLTASMAAKHVGQTATLLRNGWVLVAGGGTKTAEIYEPQRAVWVAPGAMSTVRTDAAATLLPDGHVLVTGGDGPDGQPQASAEEFLAGRGPLVTITPTTIAFGGQQVGSVSRAQSYKVTNVGSANLVVSGTTVSGKNPGDFRVGSGCGSGPVPPGGTCTVSVRFAPAYTGLRSARTGVSDDAPLSPQGPAVTGYGGGPDAWIPVGPMSTPRDSSTATLLPDGNVLMAGGETSVGQVVATAELYNPAARSFSPTGSLHTARSNAAATLLPDGQVLVAGGKGAEFANLASAELYNPATGTWRSTTPMNAGGYDLTATLLPDGSVLITGLGFGASAEVYNPATATWTDTGPMTAAQGFATATLLPDGNVLLAGGGTAAAELYNPATNDWTATGSMNNGRQGAVAALLRNGEVLVAGGDPPGGGNALTSAELYDPATGTWSNTGPLNAGRLGATATLLPDGTVLVTGGCTGGCDNEPAGLSSTEIYYPGVVGYFGLGPPMTQGRVFHTATLLANGDVLVAGGDARYGGSAVSTAELFTPPVVSAHPASGPSGTQVTVSGSGFYAGETVKLAWDSVTILGHVRTSAAGTFSTTITIPQAAPGTYQISAQGQRSFASADTPFTVTS
jgi:large repetitive protein